MNKNIKKQEGITLVALTITITVMIIIASITTYVGMDLIKQAKLQDLVTNMLLIQAKAKESLEEVNFQTANMTDTAEIEQVKNETLTGKKITENAEVQSAAQNTGKLDANNLEQYYYLEQTNLDKMGLGELNSEEYGYFIVKYDVENVKVEVINTNGYAGNYTLEQLQQLQQEE